MSGLEYEISGDAAKFVKATKTAKDAAKRDLGAAEDSIADLADAAEEAGESIEDIESAGKKAARAMNEAADDMIREIDDTKRSVDLLQEQLGQDFDRGALADAVGELKRMGLSAEDVEADIDDLVASIRRVEDVNTAATSAGFDNVDQAVGRVNTSTGKAKDSMIGFTGGAVGELPGVAGALGPVAEGMGQLTEGFLEGEVSVREFVGAGAAMAGVGILVQGLTTAWENYRAEQERREEQIRKATDALVEQSEAVDTLGDAIEGLTDTSVPAGGLVDALLGDLEEDQVKRLNAALADLGLEYSDLFSEIQNNGDDLGGLFSEVFAANTDMTEGMVSQLVTAIQATDSAADAIISLQGTTGEAGRRWREMFLDPTTNRSIVDMINSIEELDDAVDHTDFGEVLERYFDQTMVSGGRAARSLEEIRDAHPDASDLQIYIMQDAALRDIEKSAADAAEEAQQLEDAYRPATEAIAEAGDEAEDATDDIEELTDAFGDLRDELSDRSAYLDLGDSFDTVNDKAVDAWVAVKDGSEDADAAVRDHEQSVIGLKNRVIDYADEVGNIPPEQVTDIISLIDQGKLEEAQTALADLERNRTSTLTVRVHQDGGIVFPNGQRALDSGGSLGAGESALIAEKRPEFYNGRLYASPTVVTGPGTVTPGQQSGDQLRRASTALEGAASSLASREQPAALSSDSASHLMVVHVQAPKGFDPNSDAQVEALFHQLTRFEERNR